MESGGLSPAETGAKNGFDTMKDDWRLFCGPPEGPVLLEPRFFIKTPTGAEILADTLALINEIQIDWLRRDLEKPVTPPSP